MSGAKRPGPYPAEVRERAVRMVLHHQHGHGSQWKATESISKKLHVNHETLRLDGRPQVITKPAPVSETLTRDITDFLRHHW